MAEAVHRLTILREGARPLSPAEQKQALHLPGLRGIQGVFCMIPGETVTPRRCLATQGTHECFGCAAETRICETCHSATLAFPEVTMCDKCLAQALEEEARAPIEEIGNLAVPCQLAGGKHISASTCRKMQGNLCGACAAPTRLCKACKIKKCYYPDYGLCLACAVSAFGKHWLERIDTPALRSRALTIMKARPVPEPESLQRKQPEEIIHVRRPKPIENPCDRCRAAPVFFVKLGLCLDCFTYNWKRRGRPANRFFETEEARDAFLSLLPKTIRLLTRMRWVSAHRLKKLFKVSELEAQAILAALEDAQIVSQPVKSCRASRLRLIDEFAGLLAQLPETEVLPRVQPTKVPTAGVDGLLIVRGEEYRTINGWKKRIHPTPNNNLLQKCLRLLEAKPIIALMRRGHALARFYSRKDAHRAAVSKIFRQQIDGTVCIRPRNTYYRKGAYWGSAETWSRYYGVDLKELAKALKGKPGNRHFNEYFYAQQTAEKAAFLILKRMEPENARIAAQQERERLHEAIKERLALQDKLETAEKVNGAEKIASEPARPASRPTKYLPQPTSIKTPTAEKPVSEPTVEQVLEMVAEYFGITTDSLLAVSREHRRVILRWFTAYLLRNALGLSFPKIGLILRRDYNTVFHGYKKLLELMTKDREILETVKLLEQKLKQL